DATTEAQRHRGQPGLQGLSAFQQSRRMNNRQGTKGAKKNAEIISIFISSSFFAPFATLRFKFFY
ncbi:MAG TPA: hypothetical protein VGG19_17475, partial [Tepidisphaeraceae bacterium]